MLFELLTSTVQTAVSPKLIDERALSYKPFQSITAVNYVIFLVSSSGVLYTFRLWPHYLLDMCCTLPLPYSCCPAKKMKHLSSLLEGLLTNALQSYWENPRHFGFWVPEPQASTFSEKNEMNRKNASQYICNKKLIPYKCRQNLVYLLFFQGCISNWSGELQTSKMLSTLSIPFQCVQFSLFFGG